MEPFAYAHPTTTQEAVSLLSSGGDSAAILAGGTDLISLMKEHVVTPQRVISIRGVKEWNGITVSDAGIRVGALVTIDELHEHPVMKMVPGLAFAVKEAASPQLRNMGTLGGNLCQRPRCWYFRNGFGLLARDKNGKSLVPGGENKADSAKWRCAISS
jgi:xanthine dehydrogenase YagS FAD-binding subunit